ncbi:protein FAM110C [Pholidichthys leucotaenia]
MIIKITMETTSETTKILEKGPKYLRKQMELESESKGGMSAVERLAASKLKYVKSQQVVNSTQEPVINLGSMSVSSTGSSGNFVTRNDSDNETATKISSPVQAHRSNSKKRPDSLLLYRQKCELLRRSVNDRKHPIARKLQLNSLNKSAPLPEGAAKECEPKGDAKATVHEITVKECGPDVVSSQSEKRCKGEAKQYSNKSVPKHNADVTKTNGGLLTVPEVKRRPGKGVSRSHSDISSRYSKNFADFDAFFKYCGLDSDIIESLGKENFIACSDEIAINIRSVSVSTSDDDFSRSSADSDGLMEEKLKEKNHGGTSVIERNARIIKWLYSCKNANETGKKLRDLD